MYLKINHAFDLATQHGALEEACSVICVRKKSISPSEKVFIQEKNIERLEVAEQKDQAHGPVAPKAPTCLCVESS